MKQGLFLWLFLWKSTLRSRILQFWKKFCFYFQNLQFVLTNIYCDVKETRKKKFKIFGDGESPANKAPITVMRPDSMQQPLQASATCQPRASFQAKHVLDMLHAALTLCHMVRIRIRSINHLSERHVDSQFRNWMLNCFLFTINSLSLAGVWTPHSRGPRICSRWPTIVPPCFCI